MYANTYLCVYKNQNICIKIYICIVICIHVNTHETCIDTPTNTHRHTQTHTDTCLYNEYTTYKNIKCTYTYVHTYMYTYMHACMHACVCVCTYENIYLVLLVLARTGRGNSPKLHQVLCPHTQTAQKTTHRRGTKKGEKLPQCLCAQAAGVDAICVSAWRHYLVYLVYLVYLESLSEQRLDLGARPRQ